MSMGPVAFVAARDRNSVTDAACRVGRCHSCRRKPTARLKSTTAPARRVAYGRTGFSEGPVVLGIWRRIFENGPGQRTGSKLCHSFVCNVSFRTLNRSLALVGTNAAAAFTAISRSGGRAVAVAQ